MEHYKKQVIKLKTYLEDLNDSLDNKLFLKCSIDINPYGLIKDGYEYVIKFEFYKNNSLNEKTVIKNALTTVFSTLTTKDNSDVGAYGLTNRIEINKENTINVVKLVIKSNFMFPTTLLDLLHNLITNGVKYRQAFSLRPLMLNCEYVSEWEEAGKITTDAKLNTVDYSLDISDSDTIPTSKDVMIAEYLIISNEEVFIEFDGTYIGEEYRDGIKDIINRL